MIVGIVLTGGRSERMGRPKASLLIEDETFLQRAVRTLAEGGCSEVIVVLNPDEPATAELVSEGSARFTWGGGSGTQQIDSLRAGLQELPETVLAAVVLPVDHPLVRPATVTALIGAFQMRGAPIVRPSCQGRHGHPVVFDASLFSELLDDDLPEGARTVVHRHASESESVEVDDPGVIADLDTPEDYQQHVGDLP
jgi:CTP:molybdopterin cytidylyltransferase MocA